MRIFKIPLQIILVLGALFLVQPSQSHAADPAFDIFKA